MKRFLLICFLIIQAKNFSSSKRNLEDSSDDIIILHLNDVHCGVNDNIGYDGFVLYRDELYEKYPNIISVDVGDHIQGGTLGSISDGSAIINIMNKVGFDVAILGNHEFDYGIDQLSKLGETITSKYISSNFCYKKNKTSIFNPYKIIEKGGKKIAFIGVLTPLTFSKTYLSTLRDSNGDAIYDFLTDNNTQELYDRVQEIVNKVRREEEADYVILLTHIGMELEQYTSDGLLLKIKNVDAVLDGHTHLIYNITSKDKNNKDIHISQTGTKLQSIGKLIIKTNGEISSEIIQVIPEPSDKTNAIKLTRGGKEIWVNKDMNNFINDIFSQYEAELNILYGSSEYDLAIRPEGTTDSHFIYCRYQECTVGNLLADAFKSAGNSDGAIVNGGGVRSSINKGKLTRSQIMAVAPFFNNLIVKMLPGQCILDALEFGVSKHPTSSGGFPQVSGISYDIDTSLNSKVETDSQGLFLKITGKRKVTNVKINGEEIDPNKNYSISMSDFIGNGGDGYTMMAKYEVFKEGLLTDTDAIAYYIKNDLKGIIPAEYKNFQGRINLVNGSIPSISSSNLSSISSSISIVLKKLALFIILTL
jgi:2',3'-cyclic-nucleotide 2'-phosphodiesterase (5'-nucleotidase family)